MVAFSEYVLMIINSNHILETFKRFILLFKICMCAWGNTQGSQKSIRFSGAGVTISHPTSVPVTKLWSSTVCALNHWVITPVLTLRYFDENNK